MIYAEFTFIIIWGFALLAPLFETTIEDSHHD